jgi:hypothetical protein
MVTEVLAVVRPDRLELKKAPPILQTAGKAVHKQLVVQLEVIVLVKVVLVHSVKAVLILVVLHHMHQLPVAADGTAAVLLLTKRPVVEEALDMSIHHS